MVRLAPDLGYFCLLRSQASHFFPSFNYTHLFCMCVHMCKHTMAGVCDGQLSQVTRLSDKHL